MPQSGSLADLSFSKDIVNQLAAIIRTSQIHDPSNVAVQKSIERLVGLLKNVFKAENTAILEQIGEYFYLNEERIKFSMEHLLNFD